ncbi:hypothetical protein JCM10212_004488 [Sporobolomyces blumeae]
MQPPSFLGTPFPANDLCQPGGFLSHLIGHEGKGSILSVLKDKGWANGMSAGAGNGANGFEFFKIQVDLTSEGLDNYETVAQVIFAYIGLLRSTPPSETTFNEIAALSQLAFRFKESSSPSSTAMMLSMSMSKPYPRERLLSAPWLCTEWYPDQVDHLVDLLSPDQCRLFVSAQKEVGARSYTEKEQWYGTEYVIEKTSDKILHSKLTAKDFPGLALPEPNQFVPENLEIKNKVEVAEPARRPLNLSNTPTSRLWYKKDDRWWVPRAATFFLFRSPAIDASAVASVSSRLFTELVRDSLNEYSYDADLAGLSYSFEQQGDGILLSADGYNDKLAVLVKVVVRRMKELEVDRKRFDIIVDQMRRLYVNFALEEPYQHVSIDGSHLTQALSYTIDQKLAALEQITPESLRAHMKRVLERLHIEALVHGNMLKDEAIALNRSIEDILKPQALTAEELKSHQALVVPQGKHLARRFGGNPDNTNSAVEQFTYIGDLYDDSLRAKLSLFGHIVSEPLFDILRAREQLGYIVSSGPRKSIAFMGLRVIVQSEKDAAFVESRIDAFWTEFMTTLENMSDDEFDKYKEAVRTKKLEDHKNLWQEASHLWVNIHCGWYDFEQRWRDADLVQKLTKADIVSFFRDYFFETPEHPIRRLSIHLESHRLSPDQLEPVLSPALDRVGLDPRPDQAEVAKFVSTKPTLDQVMTFVDTVVKAHGKGDLEVEQVQRELRQLCERPAIDGYRVIEDVDAWRAQQERAPHAHPVKEYADLFPARM